MDYRSWNHLGRFGLERWCTTTELGFKAIEQLAETKTIGYYSLRDPHGLMTRLKH